MKQQFAVRLKITDKKKLEVIADENSRTMNGQIEFLVKQCIEQYENVKGKIDVKEKLEKIIYGD